MYYAALIALTVKVAVMFEFVVVVDAMVLECYAVVVMTAELG